MFNLFIILLIIQKTVPIQHNRYQTQTQPGCRCEKGERGPKGNAGVCPTDCQWRFNAFSRDCLGARINLERLSFSIRHLITETKQITYRNIRASPCVCPKVTTNTVSSMSGSAYFDAAMYSRLKGEKGESGQSCSNNYSKSTQMNIRLFPSLQSAIDASYTYSDHTYVHIVDEYGRLKGIYIRVNGIFIPLKLEIENALTIIRYNIPTALPVPKTKCAFTLPCAKLHLFALGPHVRRMCDRKNHNVPCGKLSDYDDICERVSSSHRLKGFYRAFMSSSNQWLINLFRGVCMNATIVNIHEEVLFNKFEDIFKQKPPQNDILDIQGLKPKFQHWWHGSYPNGTASSDTCLDWSRQDSSLSGVVSRIPDKAKGLFHHQYIWPCSISDTNIGIFCLETNCDKRNYYKH